MEVVRLATGRSQLWLLALFDTGWMALAGHSIVPLQREFYTIQGKLLTRPPAVTVVFSS